jgi:recombination protein RecR
MAKYPLMLEQLISSLKLLPGVGTKTAERFAFHLLECPNEALMHLAELLTSIKKEVTHCPICHCLKGPEGCSFCLSSSRDSSLLCILGSAKDVYAIEETHTYKGLYHVIGALLSPLDGRTIEKLNLPLLFDRLNQLHPREVIIALDSTLEGDATALYLKEKIGSMGITVSRLAFGIPIGSPLDYVDETTLSKALSGRQSF